jgi:hypothetical protein
MSETTPKPERKAAGCPACAAGILLWTCDHCRESFVNRADCEAIDARTRAETANDSLRAELASAQAEAADLREQLELAEAKASNVGATAALAVANDRDWQREREALQARAEQAERERDAALTQAAESERLARLAGERAEAAETKLKRLDRWSRQIIERWESEDRLTAWQIAWKVAVEKILRGDPVPDPSARARVMFVVAPSYGHFRLNFPAAAYPPGSSFYVGKPTDLAGLNAERHRVVVLPGSWERADWAEVSKMLENCRGRGVEVERVGDPAPALSTDNPALGTASR